MPRDPLHAFFGPLFFFGVLLLLMYLRNDHHFYQSRAQLIISFLEITVSFVVIYLLYMGYNGLILLVFCDTIYHLKDNKFSKVFLGALIIIYFLANLLKKMAKNA